MRVVSRPTVGEAVGNFGRIPAIDEGKIRAGTVLTTDGDAVVERPLREDEQAACQQHK